jgi:putative ATP-dependent endonuclease of OLD family
VVTDNDGKHEITIVKKYKEIEGIPSFKLFADDNNDLRTLEPQIVFANKGNLNLLCQILEIEHKIYDNSDKITKYMIDNKTDCALKIFSSDLSIKYPNYIIKAVDWCDED